MCVYTRFYNDRFELKAPTEEIMIAGANLYCFQTMDKPMTRYIISFSSRARTQCPRLFVAQHISTTARFGAEDIIV